MGFPSEYPHLRLVLSGMFRRLPLVMVVALVGPACVSSRDALLVPHFRAALVTAAPLECGPMGFRRVPLQSRWGEYLKVTVSAPRPLRGDARVTVNGRAMPLERWETGAPWNFEQPQQPVVLSASLNSSAIQFYAGVAFTPLAPAHYEAVVVDAVFPNEDVDARSALSSDGPIDVTISELAGESCEGAVFTVEQGELRPNISEAAWIAELERRGGPELIARREALRRAADERRQAYLAELEVRTAARREHEAAVRARLEWCDAHFGECPELAVRQPVLPGTFPLSPTPFSPSGVEGVASTPFSPSGVEGVAQTSASEWHAGLQLTAEVGLSLAALGCAWPVCAGDVRPTTSLGLRGPTVFVACRAPVAGLLTACACANPTGSQVEVVASGSLVLANPFGSSGVEEPFGSSGVESGPVTTSIVSGASVGSSGVAEPFSSSGVESGPATTSSVGSSGTAVAASSGAAQSAASVSGASLGASVGGEVAVTATDSGEWSLPAQAEWSMPSFEGGASLQRVPVQTSSVAAAPVRRAPVYVEQSASVEAHAEVSVVPFLLDLLAIGANAAIHAPPPAPPARCANCQPVHAAVPVTAPVPPAR